VAAASQIFQENSQMVNFKTTAAEAALIQRIADRGYNMMMDAWNSTPARMRRLGADKQSLEMDITACHCNGCPMDLARLLAADDANFAHDFFGIHKHLDRTSGRLGNCFYPRFHAREEAPS
jgi:hypothetical protein